MKTIQYSILPESSFSTLAFFFFSCAAWRLCSSNHCLIFFYAACLVISDPCYSIMGLNLGSSVTFSQWSYYWPFNKSAAFPPLLCVLHHIFFFICGIFMKREMKGSRSLVLCSHIFPLQRLWTGVWCLLWFYVGYTLSSKVGGQEASLSCR